MSQEWLLVSCSAWHLIPDYQRLEEFARNLPVTNDIAERVGGLDLTKSFLSAVFNKIEFYRTCFSRGSSSEKF